MRTVEVHQAWVWDCEKCGGENFCRAIVADPMPDEKEELYRELNDQPFGDLPPGWENFQMMTRPDVVACVYCGGCFETTDCREE